MPKIPGTLPHDPTHNNPRCRTQQSANPIRLQLSLTGTTEGIEQERLPAILVGFATEQELSGTTRRLGLVVAVVVYSRGDIYELLDRAAADVEGILSAQALVG
ncbi:hypothetical protein MJO52_12855 [Microbulbifer variabilis]|uniref:Uncharacterized protein n=1 Tax=Microbulbifer variabilis TaxID=266805 RepID=A0ABY4V6W1_9GAMM|nr:hypothetical protein [Microbulbifer variabilis]USD19968.1 hypothetical protein MJO52_12855 [Microbulbifer variabilis]